ncbi:RrF2 family transcriptional regulator [Pseudothermotoga thermarum]|uniref:Transcriptional regulator, BadM/Rrf2 family n=1 Tax=Pseudothermotoga thermarum DSM 5069 TaxID=688269 RepID=F7YV49_9THEM|nr:Rrf2 family transcriptional regulator [Pseudothermotoga thermarum]AEH50348.1 transcriptional regulator, BadM/Rrf2 family [Pseudothermotoga thermarum DSM 5069]
MKVSTTSRYGLRALIDLAAHSHSSYVSLASIAERQKISQKYLESIFKILAKAGIVRAVKGAYGGYKIVDEALQISVKKILEILESNLKALSPQSDDHFDRFIEEFLWQRLTLRIENLLDSITLKDLVREYTEIMEPNSLMYYI